MSTTLGWLLVGAHVGVMLITLAFAWVARRERLKTDQAAATAERAYRDLLDLRRRMFYAHGE